jgi:hypothetical protein
MILTVAVDCAWSIVVVDHGGQPERRSGERLTI